MLTNGPTFRIQVNAKPARNAETIERVVRAFSSEPNGGLLVLLDFVTLAHRDLIIRLAAEYLASGPYAACFCRQRRSDLIWHRLGRPVSSRRVVYRPHPQGREACRTTGATAN